MDNITFLQLIMSDGIFSLELLALFAIGFYLILAIMAYPSGISTRHLSYDKMAKIKTDPALLQIGFNLGTILGVGAVVSPPRTWLRQDANSSK